MGQAGRRRADIETAFYAVIGKEGFLHLSNNGPDDLHGQRVQIESYWLDPDTNQPRYHETVEYSLSLNVVQDDYQRVRGFTVPADLSKRPLPEFAVKVTPVDFDDPDTTNNTFGGWPDMSPWSD